MIKSKKHNKSASESTARVVDGKLILSLPGAQTPVVWQMDLDQAKASALEVRSDDKKGLYTLSLKTPRGAADDIADFTSKDEAVDGLLAASAALENAHGQIRPSGGVNMTPSNSNAPQAQPKKSGGWKKWLLALVVLIGLWFLFTLSATILPQAPGTYTGASTEQAAESAQSARESQGVPVSADDFLRQ